MKLAVVVNEVAGGWSPTGLDRLGGGEEAVVRLARAFASKGHEVTVFYDGRPLLDQSKVQYRHYREAKPDSFDIAIYRKCPDKVALKLAPRNFLWQDQTVPFDPTPFERIIVASHFLERIVSQLTPACAHKVVVVREGIDFTAYPYDDMPEREPQHVVYTSSPDRGLKELLTIWPTILKSHPNATLSVTYGWEQFDACGGSQDLKRELLALAELAGPSVQFTGRLSYADMFRLYAQAGVWAYPCNGGEHYCHSAVRAQCGGAIPVVIPWGALQETVWSGAKAKNLDEFTAALIATLYPDQQLRDELECYAPDYPASRSFKLPVAHVTSSTPPFYFTWDMVADMWTDEVFNRATDEATKASFLSFIPLSPPFDVTLESQVAPRVWPILAQWLESVQSQRPWMDDSLGIKLQQANPIAQPKLADAVILGFGPEDCIEQPDVWLKRFALPDRTPVAFIISHGSFRAKTRHRVMTRRDVADVFGKQPELQLRSIPLDNEGSAITVGTFRYVEETLGKRDLARAKRTLGPRQTLSACFITKDAADTIGNTLRALTGIVDEVCILDNGSTDNTLEEIDRFAKESGVPTRVQTDGYNPRYCFDCLKVHELGDVQHGHRVAGFETPRNQSLAMAQGDWIIWLDADEQLVNGRALGKYLKHNSFEGYCIQQHHFSVDPPQAMKVDLPVRVFRRKVDTDNPTHGLIEYGPHKWPTYHSGLTVRFGGLVHEHPGFAPTYGEGVGPVIILSDIWLAHSGYYTEQARRKRFVRNWPLMVSDRLKYPERRLGKFLWIRDLTHQMRYILEQTQGKRTQEVDMFANEALAIWRESFVESNDPFSPEALQYVKVAQQVLGRGVEIQLQFRAKRPEMTGDETEAWDLDGRFETREQLLKAITAKLGGLERWEEPYI
jgi:glycosyltransferase involved in cell wall biosynthesis